MNNLCRRVTRPLLLVLFAAFASGCCWHPCFTRGGGHGYGGGGHHHFRHCR